MKSFTLLLKSFINAKNSRKQINISQIFEKLANSRYRENFAKTDFGSFCFPVVDLIGEFRFEWETAWNKLDADRWVSVILKRQMVRELMNNWTCCFGRKESECVHCLRCIFGVGRNYRKTMYCAQLIGREKYINLIRSLFIFAVNHWPFIFLSAEGNLCKPGPLSSKQRKIILDWSVSPLDLVPFLRLN